MLNLNREEAEAIGWVMDTYGLDRVEVEEVTDESGVGWLAVRGTKPVRGSGWRRNVWQYRVSPRGHVYDEQGNRVRDMSAVPAA